MPRAVKATLAVHGRGHTAWTQEPAWMPTDLARAGSSAAQSGVIQLDGVTDYRARPVDHPVLPEPVALDRPVNQAGWPDQATAPPEGASG